MIATARIRRSLSALSLSVAVLAGAQSPTATNESFTIGPADLLHIKVLEAPELEQSVRVTDAGTVPLLAGGELVVRGLTPGQAAAAVADRLRQRDFVLHAHVSVIIDQSATQIVSVIGQVKNPGAITIGTPRSALQILSMAGGLTDLANHTVTIRHARSGQQVSFDVSNVSATALSNDVLVYPGDTIFVPKSDIVYLLGDLGRPGGYPVPTNDSRISVLQAVAYAGGTPPTAVPNDARLIRRKADGTREEIPLKLSDMQKGKLPDMPMQADDILYVPFSYTRNAMLGVTNLISAASSAAIYAVR